VKILHLATFLQGGAGRVMVDLVAEQRAAGHDVDVVASRTSVPEAGYSNHATYLDELAGLDVPVHLVDSTFVREHAANLAVVRALDGLCPPGHAPDVIHAHAAIPSLVALVFAGARRHPMAVVQTMHGWSGAKTPGQVATDVALMNLVDRVAVPSHHAAEVIASVGVARSRIVVVAHGVGDCATELDLRDRAALRDMARARQAGLLVAACVGTIGARKNQRVLVEAIRRMTGPRSVFCMFMGDGDAADLGAAIAAAGLGGRVRVHGYSRGARRLAAAADVLVLPSRSEGQPLAVLEAFCDGTLVLVSDIPELSELVEDGATGLRFAVDDAASLSAALDRLSIMPAEIRRAITSRARLLQASRFTTTLMANHYADLYRESLHAHLPASAPRPMVTPAA
jgi:glycosyltransferase involved in cell wall biosynthesis